MEAKDKPNYQTIEGLQQHPLFVQMNQRMKKFLVRFLETSDRVLAMREGYGDSFKNDMGRKIYAHKLLRYNRNIRSLIEIFTGDTSAPGEMSKREFNEIVSARLREKDLTNRDFIGLAQVYLETQTWRNLKKKTNFAPQGRGKSEDDVDVLVRKIERERSKS